VDITGQAFNDVMLECAPELLGDVLSIHLSQQSASAAVWTLEIKVQIAQGIFTLGFITTNPPSAGDPSSRTVGFAVCPGATGWSVLATCPTAGEMADLVIQSSKCCGSNFGVTPNVFVEGT